MTDYPHPYATCDIVLFREIEINTVNDSAKDTDSGYAMLLIKRKNPPYQGMWALPGGFMDENESASQTALRELEEETGVTGVSLSQFYTFTTPGRDPRGWTITCAYYAVISEDIRVSSGDDAAAAAWFSLQYKNEDNLAKILLISEEGENLAATVSFEDSEPEIIADTGLAFDHAAIIALACRICAIS